jgi:hypothetical protein
MESLYDGASWIIMDPLLLLAEIRFRVLCYAHDSAIVAILVTPRMNFSVGFDSFA